MEIVDENEFIKDSGCVGLAQINPTAGNLEYNSKKIIEFIKKGENLDLDMVLFPRNAMLGSNMQDFINRFPFILEETQKWLEKIAQNVKKTAVLLGYYSTDYKFYYAILRHGQIDKILEEREFISSKHFHDGIEFYIKPSSLISRTGSEFLNEKNLKEIAQKNKRVVLEINQVGTIDCWSYAGHSKACDENGTIFARAKEFEEQLLIINPFTKRGRKYSSEPLQIPNKFSLDYEQDLERIYKSAVQGIKDYFTKCGLKRAVLGLSGGLDSTVCAVLLVDALGKDNVFGVLMPSKLTSEESKSDAQKLAENLNIGFYEASIKPMFDTTNTCLQKLFTNIERTWTCRYKQSFTPDNIQARSRAIYLWGIANEFESCIPIATSDKSELYMGYATINGDMSGGYAPIADITKTKLFALADWMNKNRKQKNSIPKSILLKRPGAELAIDPNTGEPLCAEDALMPYEFMDEVIWRIENWHESYQELLTEKFIYEEKNEISKKQKQEWLEKFFKRMSFSLYKGFILPPATIIDSHSILKGDYYQPITSCHIEYKEMLFQD